MNFSCKMISTIYLTSLVLVLSLQEIWCNQHVAIDKNNSDQSKNHINQRSSQQQNSNEAYHPSTAPTLLNSKQFTTLTTNPSILMGKSKSTTASSSDLAANEQNRFRRSSSSISSGEADATSNVDMDTDDEIASPPINFLRLYFCGAGYQNCLYDERLSNMQSDFLKQIPRMAEVTLPTNFIDWKSKQLNLPINVRPKNHGNSAGRREWPLLVDEPHYVIIRSDEAKPQHLALLSSTDFLDDPFIPQRGRRQSKSQTYDDPFIPMRGRRANAQPWDDPFYPMRGRRADKNANTWDDPFFPMRGRRADKSSDTWDDPFFPMRGRRGDKVSDTFDDPFIPMRGRRSVVRSDDSTRIKRSLLAHPGAINAVYTPTEEVIVKLNGVVDGKHSSQDSSKHASNSNTNKWLNEATKLVHQEQQHSEKLQPNRLIESTNSPLSSASLGYKRSVLNKIQQQKQLKSFFIPNGFNSNSDDDDSDLMNDYSIDYYLESPQPMNRNRMRPLHLSMKSSTDLSQNRDAGNLARGRETSLSF